VIRTSRRQGRETVSESNAKRCGELSERLCQVMDDWRPWIIGTEAQSWTRRHKADTQVAQAFGVLFALAGMDNCPVVHLPPQQVKMTACGRKNASKADVQAALSERLRFYAKTVGQIPKSHLEHAADAAAVALAAERSDLARALSRKAKIGD
jgi:Holliday junction resolvasome RuvABC endonuclease subunit